MGVDMDAIVDLFLKGSALQDTICILCNHRDMFCSDPITDTVSLMISQPISMAIGEGGLMLFGRRPDMTIPFTCMSREQLQYVGGIADELIVSINTSGEGVHMCGGVVVIPCKKKSNVRLNADEVVRALVACVRRKNDMCDDWATNALVNVIVQRLASVGNVSVTNLWQAVEAEQRSRAEVVVEA